MTAEITPTAPAATPAPVAQAPLAPEAAQSRIAELKADRVFQKRFAAGDNDARGEMDKLHLQAYPEQPAEAAKVATEHAHLTEMGFPPATAEQFQLPAIDDAMIEGKEDLKALHTATRTWLATAGFTKEIGSSLVSEVDRTWLKHEAMSEGQREHYRSTEFSKLERLWGAETKDNIRLAKQLVQELEKRQPGLVAVLEETGAGNSSMVIAQIAMHAQRLAERHGKTK